MAWNNIIVSSTSKLILGLSLVAYTGLVFGAQSLEGSAELRLLLEWREDGAVPTGIALQTARAAERALVVGWQDSRRGSRLVYRQPDTGAVLETLCIEDGFRMIGMFGMPRETGSEYDPVLLLLQHEKNNGVRLLRIGREERSEVVLRVDVALGEPMESEALLAIRAGVCGDVDADGVADVLIAVFGVGGDGLGMNFMRPSSVNVVSGSTGLSLHAFAGKMPKGFGWAVAAVPGLDESERSEGGLIIIASPWEDVDANGVRGGLHVYGLRGERDLVSLDVSQALASIGGRRQIGSWTRPALLGTALAHVPKLPSGYFFCAAVGGVPGMVSVWSDAMPGRGSELQLLEAPDRQFGFAESLTAGCLASGAAVLLIGHPDADTRGQDCGSILVYNIEQRAYVMAAHGLRANDGLGIDVCVLGSLDQGHGAVLAGKGTDCILVFGAPRE